ncbi:hypothetical protein RUM43_000995 [Polyplax serrata]|uniref:Uncharacterized protein n=1 Tax=Polyplax serrata TaxID=468196 RepID=A0AAN8XRC2_POLSC
MYLSREDAGVRRPQVLYGVGRPGNLEGSGDRGTATTATSDRDVKNLAKGLQTQVVKFNQPYDVMIVSVVYGSPETNFHLNTGTLHECWYDKGQPYVREREREIDGRSRLDAIRQEMRLQVQQEKD